MAFEFSVTSLRPLDFSGIGETAAAAPTAAQPAGAGFAEALQNAAQNTVADLRAAEGTSLQALSGESNVREVTDAVMTAEQNLQAAIAIRDKIVTAFLEVSRMQI